MWWLYLFKTFHWLPTALRLKSRLFPSKPHRRYLLPVPLSQLSAYTSHSLYYKLTSLPPLPRAIHASSILGLCFLEWFSSISLHDGFSMSFSLNVASSRRPCNSTSRNHYRSCTNSKGHLLKTIYQRAFYHIKILELP